MKRLELLFALLIAVLDIYSQSRIFVSVEASPTYSYRTYTLKDYSTGDSNTPSGKLLYDLFKKYSDSIESPILGFQMSANIGYRVTDNLVLMSGFHYNRIGYKINKTTPIGHFIVNGNIVSTIYNNIELDLYSNIYYFGIPIGIQYRICNIGKINLGFNIGSSFDFLVKHAKKDFPNTKEDYSAFSKIAIDINAGIQLGYTINDKFEVYLTPHFSNYITSNVKFNSIILDNLFVKINQYNYYGGIKFGVKYKL